MQPLGRVCCFFVTAIKCCPLLLRRFSSEKKENQGIDVVVLRIVDSSTRSSLETAMLILQREPRSSNTGMPKSEAALPAGTRILARLHAPDLAVPRARWRVYKIGHNASPGRRAGASLLHCHTITSHCLHAAEKATEEGRHRGDMPDFFVPGYGISRRVIQTEIRYQYACPWSCCCGQGKGPVYRGC